MPKYIIDGESGDMQEIKTSEEIKTEAEKPFYGVLSWKDNKDGSRDVKSEIFDNAADAAARACSLSFINHVLADNKKDFYSLLRLVTLQDQ